MDESGTDGEECSRKVASGRRVAGGVRSIVNARDLQLECASLMYGNETVLWKKEINIRVVQMDNLIGLLGIGRMYKDDKGVVRSDEKGVDGRIDEGVL